MVFLVKLVFVRFFVRSLVFSWWCAFRATTHEAAAHGRVVQISGNAGEWTNGDDLDNAARVRLHKEARTNRHKAGGGKKRKVQPGPRDPPPPPRRWEELDPQEFPPLGPDDPGDEPEAPPPAPPVVLPDPIHRYAISAHHRMAWNGSHVLVRTDNGYVDPRGTIHPHSCPDRTIVVGGKGGPGWCIEHDPDNPPVTHSLLNPIVPFTLPAWSYLGQAIPATRGFWFTPSRADLAAEFPSTGRVDHARVKAATAYLTKKYVPLGMPMSVVKGCVDHWLYHECEARANLLESTATLRALGNGVISAADAGITRQCARLQINTDFNGWYRENGVECVIPDDYAFKRIYTVIGTGCEVDVDEGVYPRFATQRAPDALAKYYRTVFCSFQGNCEPFLLYDVTANNAAKAVKRLLGARENEELYYRSQASVLAALDSKGLIRGGILKELKVVRRGVQRPYLYEQSVGAWEVGRGVHSHLVDYGGLSAAVAKPFFRGARQLLARCNRTYLTRFVERLLTLTPASAFGDLGRSLGSHIARAGRDVSEWAHWDYYSGFCNYLEHLETDVGRLTNAEINHAKKALRLAYVTNVIFHHDDDIMVERLNGAVKRELAKYGKVPRIYVSYQAGCMYANELPELVKVAFDAPFHFAKGELVPGLAVRIHIMAKPRDDAMSILFGQLMEATMSEDTLVVVIYSDDSVYAGRVNGESFGFNVDISSCDASNNSLVFGLTGSCLAGFSLRRARGLIKQCMLPITIRNPNNAAEKLVVRFHSAFEGSGTVLTTVLNHVASFLIAVGVATQLSAGLPPDEAIVRGAMITGHKVTVDSWCEDGCPVFERIQFLKHSPIMATTGEWVPTLNIGCVLRSLGSIEGDLEPKHFGVTAAEFALIPIQDRMDRFLGGVVRGLVHEPKSRVLDALRSRFVVTGETALDTRRGVTEVSGPVPSCDYERSVSLGVDRAISLKDRSNRVLCEESFCRRYGITQGDVDELVGHIQQTKLGSVSVTCATTNFYRVDYGVPPIGLHQ